MPYKLQRVDGGYYVVKPDGKRMSQKPMPKKSAIRQMSALYASEKSRAPLSVLKDRAGQYRWIAFSSNAFRDDDGEIVSRKALEEDVDRSDQSGRYGPLLWWHTDNAEIGDCDYRAFIGRTLVESGTFRNKEIAEAIARNQDSLGLSIGFKYRKQALDGRRTFHEVQIYERSVLPRKYAANPLTKIEVVKEDEMNIAEKIKALAELVGLEKAEETLGVVRETEADGEEEGREFKAKKAEEAEEEEKAEAEMAEAEAEEEAEEEKPAKQAEDKAKRDDDPLDQPLTLGEFLKYMEALMADEEDEEGKKESRIAELESELEEADAALEAAIKRIKELESAAKPPRGFVASQSDETVQDEGSRVKSAAPHEDNGLGEFMKFLTQ